MSAFRPVSIFLSYMLITSDGFYETRQRTIFMMPREDYSFLSSSLIKEVAYLGGSMKGLVPKEVESALRDKFKIVRDIFE